MGNCGDLLFNSLYVNQCLVLMKFGFKLFGSYNLYSFPWLCSRFKFVNSFSWVLIGEWEMAIFLGYVKISFPFFLPLRFSLFYPCLWICYLFWKFPYVICKLELKWVLNYRGYQSLKDVLKSLHFLLWVQLYFIHPHLFDIYVYIVLLLRLCSCYTMTIKVDLLSWM